MKDLESSRGTSGEEATQLQSQIDRLKKDLEDMKSALAEAKEERYISP